MNIILLKDIENVGEKHQIVTVKDGYGRNYLIPQQMAIVANDTNRRKLAELIRQEDAKEAKKIGEYQDTASKLSATTLKIGAKTGTSGKIFGSVTNVQLAQAILEQIGIEIPRKKIIIQDEVKELGTYVADVLLHKQVVGKVNFEVVSE